MACSFGEALFIFTGAAAAVAAMHSAHLLLHLRLPPHATNPRSPGREQFRTKISRFIVSQAAML